MPHRTLALALTAAALIAATPAHAATGCVKPADQAAFQTRVLQSSLMVAALNCDAQTRYDSFATKFSTELNNHGNALTGWFKRTHGRNAQTQLDRFKTTLANNASARHLNATRTFCNEAAALFTSLESAASPSQLAEIASKQVSADSYEIPPCKAQKTEKKKKKKQ